MSGTRPWVFDLIARDDDVRWRALDRHQALVTAHRDGVVWIGGALADRNWETDRMIFDYLDAFVEAEPGDAGTYAPFAVLYLRWEAHYPDEWRLPASNRWSPWTRKEVVIRWLDRHGVPTEINQDIVELIGAAVRRPYRCKDWWYGRLVRHVAGTGLLDELRHVDDPRARYIRDLVDHPEWTVTRTTYRRWLEGRG